MFIDEYGFKLSTDKNDNPESLTLEIAVFQSLGEASMCWSDTPTGIFDSTKAKECGERLIRAIREQSLA